MQLSGIHLQTVMSLFGIRKKKNTFDENKKKSFGIVVGHDRKQQISLNEFTCDLKIKIPEINDNNVFLCVTSGVKPEDYPVGCKVDIYYTRGTGRIPVVKAKLIEPSNKLT